MKDSAVGRAGRYDKKKKNHIAILEGISATRDAYHDTSFS